LVSFLVLALELSLLSVFSGTLSAFNCFLLFSSPEPEGVGALEDIGGNPTGSVEFDVVMPFELSFFFSVDSSPQLVEFDFICFLPSVSPPYGIWDFDSNGAKLTDAFPVAEVL